jgi:hypothetical protein
MKVIKPSQVQDMLPLRLARIPTTLFIIRNIGNEMVAVEKLNDAHCMKR